MISDFYDIESVSESYDFYLALQKCTVLGHREDLEW